MKLKFTAQAGSLESCDVLVVVNPLENGEGRKIELESTVMAEFGKSIIKDIEAVLDKFSLKDVELIVNDRGALTPTIKARVEVAILRSGSDKGVQA
jgi:citrate lyase subunit gamma (acyl carrier protein)